MNAPINLDLEVIWKRIKFDLEKLSGKSIFLTGSTGAFGVWILSVILYAQERGVLTKKLYVLSRDPSRFIDSHQKLCSSLDITWISGDIRTFPFFQEKIDFCIHGATTSAKETFLGAPNYEKYLTVTQGTQRILEFVKKSNVDRLLYLSSGAIFGGNLDSDRSNLDELRIPKVDHLNSTYTLGHAKRSAETLCFLAREELSDRIINVARLFSFIGPYLPLDVHYAIGNFLGAAAFSKPIMLNSDGTSVRSFMYMADAVIWIFKSLLLNTNSSFPLHIGSDKAISIRDVAELIASITGSEVSLGHPYTRKNSPAPLFYVPSTMETRRLLDVSEWTGISESIGKTLDWLQSNNKF